MTKLSPVASIPFAPMCWFLNERIVVSIPLPRMVMLFVETSRSSSKLNVPAASSITSPGIAWIK